MIIQTKAAVSQALKLHETTLNKRVIRVTPCGKRTKRSDDDGGGKGKKRKRKKEKGDAPPMTGALRRLKAKGMDVGGGERKRKRERSAFEGRRGSEVLMGRLKQEEKDRKKKNRNHTGEKGGKGSFRKGSRPKSQSPMQKGRGQSGKGRAEKRFPVKKPRSGKK